MLTYKKINLTEHLQELYLMDVSAFKRPYDLPSRSVAETAAYLDGCDIYLGYEGDVAVGLIAYKKHLGKVEVKQVLVLPAHQKKGYGSLLLKHFLTIVGKERIWLVTHPKNTPAIILYLTHGFTITGMKENYYGDGQPRLILEKE